ncbi:MAG: HIT family protein [Planctomycetota bacterium]|jgi:ATP adenylyltransferase
MEWNSIDAPWRIDYIRKLPPEGEPACFLCEAWDSTDRDADRYVLHRAGAGMIVMNRYPYSNGHLMVVPGDHVSDLGDMTVAGRAGLMELIVLAERVIGATMNPQGVNIGFNIGRAAGAGLPGHLHAHLVPRWGGDTNFMHVVGSVRVIPQAMDQVYAEMRVALDKILAG